MLKHTFADARTTNLDIEVDSLEEERLVTYVQMAKYLDGLWRYYNHNVNDQFFVVGDLVLRRK